MGRILTARVVSSCSNGRSPCASIEIEDQCPGEHQRVDMGSCAAMPHHDVVAASPQSMPERGVDRQPVVVLGDELAVVIEDLLWPFAEQPALRGDPAWRCYIPGARDAGGAVECAHR